MTIRLPCPESLRWSHSTNSLKRLEKALDDEQINAIEADILMGQCTEESIICEGSLNQAGTTQSCDIVPIMAHPPNRSSCLSLQSFLNLALKPSSKHIKLDMKELRAVSATLACLLARIENCKLERDSTQQSTTIFLNADIFPGPGCRDSLECVEATSFVVECKEFRGKAKGLKNATSFDLALSLGFKVDYREKEGYTEEDCKKVSDLVRNYYLEDEFGLVLALNARLLCLSPRVFDSFLNEFPRSQLLAWTGTGEPPIARSSIETVFENFERNQLGERIGFDCCVGE